MYKVGEYKVIVKVNAVDGCGNPVNLPTEGDIRRALESLADSVVVEQNRGGDRKLI